MTTPPPDITVITITRTRPQLLQRALAAVTRACGEAALEHRILVDACAETEAMLRAHRTAPHRIWKVAPRAPHEHSGPGRSSALRNLGVAEARGRYIAFIDDDNDWEPGHLASLLALARASGAPAVHSSLKMFHRDGRPWCEDRVPWAHDEQAGRAHFSELVALGVCTRGSNIFHDRADPPGQPGGARTVDTGAWLIARDLLLEIPFRTDFSAADADSLTGEDDKLLSDLLAAGVRPRSTGQATLRYFTGGYSNRFDAPFDDSFSWRSGTAS
ncbi:MAG: glycosyltransferase family 2 protein [Oceanicaulis sp.]|nr:glycosyltransferase family 2 protein [Oceanicaulis sp.]